MDNGVDKIDFSEIERTVHDALRSFIGSDWHLVEVNASERSMTHKIACKLEMQPLFKGWDVDCEYNRDKQDRKKIDRWRQQSGDRVKRQCDVYPDIIVHHRGTDENLLAIEAKKRSGCDLDIGECQHRDHRCMKTDREKVESYISELGYQFGLLLCISDPLVRDCKMGWWRRSADGGSEAIRDALQTCRSE